MWYPPENNGAKIFGEIMVAQGAVSCNRRVGNPTVGVVKCRKGRVKFLIFFEIPS
jgi:hypothetical protein